MVGEDRGLERRSECDICFINSCACDMRQEWTVLKLLGPPSASVEDANERPLSRFPIRIVGRVINGPSRDQEVFTWAVVARNGRREVDDTSP